MERSASAAITARGCGRVCSRAGFDQKHKVCLADTRPERYDAEENRGLMPLTIKPLDSGRALRGSAGKTLTKSQNIRY